MRTLRSRLILSHMLPVLLIIPILGLILIYVIKTQIVLPMLSTEVTQQARMLVASAHDQPQIWHDPSQATAFLQRYAKILSARCMLIDAQGHVLSASDSYDPQQLGQPLQQVQLQQALAGEQSKYAL